jgi:hypothetical protein
MCEFMPKPSDTFQVILSFQCNLSTILLHYVRKINFNLCEQEHHYKRQLISAKDWGQIQFVVLIYPTVEASNSTHTTCKHRIGLHVVICFSFNYSVNTVSIENNIFVLLGWKFLKSKRLLRTHTNTTVQMYRLKIYLKDLCNSPYANPYDVFWI